MDLYEDGFISNDEAVKRLYKNGMSKSVIAEKIKISKTEVNSIIKRDGDDSGINNISE